ncbi:MAG: HlyD family efflux transporter periplasmic adaptor subunit [Verrucomicrobiota bacterium]
MPKTEDPAPEKATRFSLVKKRVASLWPLLISLIRENRGLLISGLILGVFILAVGWYILFPQYLSPNTKFYSSGLGYPAMMRKLGKPLPAVVAPAGERTFERHIMGEGLAASDPVLVPVIPLTSILKVNFKEGDRVNKGDIMAVLDDEIAQIKLKSAKLAVSTAENELARVIAGSAYVLAQERPKMEQVNLKAESARIELARDKVARYRRAFEKGVVSKVALVDAEREFAGAEQAYSEAKLRIAMAEQGVTKSLQIARNAVADAKEAVLHRTLELENYVVRSPIDGIVERVLIKDGEYNPDPGKPGFVVVKNLWFETFFDQSDFYFVKPGLKGEVRLEAYPGMTFNAEVDRITPVVSFNEGGPEISRPLRPRGSGAPEWAATFKAQLNFTEVPDNRPVAMGMTGFGRLTVSRRNTAIPRSALLSISAGSGIVYLATKDGNWEAREVKVGIVDDFAAEILVGIEPGEEVIIEGQWVLREADKIEITETREFDYEKDG